MNHFSATTLILAATALSVVMGSASLDERFKRDAVDSHAEDMARMSELNKNLKSMGNLKYVKSQRRSDQIDVPFSDAVTSTSATTSSTSTTTSTTTTSPPLPPMARMAVEAEVSQKPASTAAPVNPSYPSTVVPANSSIVTPVNASVESQSGSRDCVHPKDLSCSKEKSYDGKTVSVGVVNK